jgi:predicted RNase H-like HicB family nuclease
MKSKYELIVFWSDDDQCFLVEVPELAGCMADGNSYAEAVANAELVIQKWQKLQPNLEGLFLLQEEGCVTPDP